MASSRVCQAATDLACSRVSTGAQAFIIEEYKKRRHAAAAAATGTAKALAF